MIYSVARTKRKNGHEWTQLKVSIYMDCDHYLLILAFFIPFTMLLSFGLTRQFFDESCAALRLFIHS
jgi:hypothetical protein